MLGFNHTSFTVASLERAIGFFCDGLGFELVSRAPRDSALIESMTGVPGAAVEIAFVRGPGHTVELIEYYGPRERDLSAPRMCDTGACHLALNIAGMDAALGMAAGYGFRALGQVITIDAGPNRGSRVVYLRNPDAITVEFIEKPDAG